jgi:DNA-binding LacI/PurR family transcriptional regulator
MTRIGCRDIDRLLIDCGISPGQDSIGQTFEHFRAWMRNPTRPDFSAIFTVDWTGALAVMRALREDWQLEVPRDISLISYAGETPIASFLQPPLTTVAANLREVAEQCLHMLETQLRRGKPQHNQTKVLPFIVERQSTQRVGESVWPDTSPATLSGEGHVFSR